MIKETARPEISVGVVGGWVDLNSGGIFARVLKGLRSGLWMSKETDSDDVVQYSKDRLVPVSGVYYQANCSVQGR